ncbi:MAG: hypothetical protein Q8P98_06140 [Candidatus Rokubacteria bacterium]|nr:hypothetical protein [Candidatus Rokubacteria bacterium]
MRAICAWCRAEGSPADLGEREPLEDPDETHGFCQRHLTQFLAAARSRPSAGLRLLIVVKRSDQSLYEYLTRAMAGVEGVHVMVDRRHGERRREARSVPGERRQADRRQSRDVVHSIGCTFVRFPPAYGAAATL